MDRLRQWIDQLLARFRPPPPLEKPPPSPPVPIVPLPPPAVPPSPPPPVTLVTTLTPFRDSGTITVTRMREILAAYPLGAEVLAIHEAIRGQCLPVAQSWMESRYGQDDNAQSTHNPLGLLWYSGCPITQFLPVQANGVTINLLVFPTWGDAFAEWQRRMDDPHYKGGVYMPDDMPLRDFFSTYVGGPQCKSSGRETCGNNETKTSIDHYEQQTVARINRYLSVPSSSPPPPPQTPPSSPPSPDSPPRTSDGRLLIAYQVAGSSKQLWLPEGIRFRQILTPRGPNRSGLPLEWAGTTQHETGNERPGTGALMHSRWQDSGTPGHPDGYVGVHFYVDDKEIIQKIPVNEQGIHAGDWRNQQHTSIERCVNPDQSPFVRSEENSSWLQAALLRILNKSAADQLYPHHPGQGNCPVHINTHWSEFERQTDARRMQLPPA